MINKRKAEMYCAEPIEKIENYEKAIADKERVWVCHHVWETMLDYTAEELIEINEYYGIPACNLIFLTRSEHTRIHSIGEKNNFFGKKHTEESKKKMSNSRKGKFNNNRSKPVLQYTLFGNLVKEWPSSQEAGRNGYSQGAVSNCCLGKQKSHKGYIWKYK